MAAVTLRPATAADLPALARLHRASFPHDPWDEAALDALRRLEGGWNAVAWQAGAPVGFLLARQAADEGEILTLCVDSSRRRQGIARLLLAALLADFEQLNIAAITLEVAENNDAALTLYRSAGFQLVGRRKAYYRVSGKMSVNASVLRRTVP